MRGQWTGALLCGVLLLACAPGSPPDEVDADARCGERPHWGSQLDCADYAGCAYDLVPVPARCTAWCAYRGCCSCRDLPGGGARWECLQVDCVAPRDGGAG